MFVIDSDASNQSTRPSFEEKEYLLNVSSDIERGMAMVAINRNQFDVAEGHCHRCLANLRRLGVE
jgi:hypothetical protein